MTTRRWIAVLGLLAMVAGSDPRVSSQGAATIGGFVKVSEVRVTRTVSEFTYRATLTNGGPALAGATGTATSVAPATTVGDGSVTFGPVGPGGSVVSSDTFTFRHDRTVVFDWANLVWAVSTTVANVAPVANAGLDQTAGVGTVVTLDGSGSSDGNGDPLTYAWTLVTRPVGSLAALSNPTAVQPTFTVDQPGEYRVRLVVHDGTVGSAPDEVVVSTSNSAPVAQAGPDQSALVGQTVTLDGSGSSDADGNALTFAWSVVSRPAGSTAVPTPATAVGPTVVIDRAGTYVFALRVDDGTETSAPDTVTISTVNTAPVAAAGPDQAATLGQVVTLDGSGSSDADGDPLTFAWSLTVPAGSGAVLSNATAVQPTFAVDLVGTYVAQLIVHDGTVASVADTVVVSTTNVAPVAAAGPDQAVVAGALVLLDGTGSSDADGDPLTFAWSLTRPPGSAAVLTGANTAGPSFVADVPGDYLVQLVVHDGQVASAPDTVTISTTNVAPVAQAGPDQLGVPLAQVVTLDGSGSSDADGHLLTYAWAFTSMPAGSAAVLSGATTGAPTFTPDLVGDYLVQLQVSDGFVTSAIDTVLVRPNAPPEAVAGPDQTVTVGAVVGVDGSGSSDPEAQPLTYQWVLTRPAGSGAALSGATTVTPSFTVDVAGAYTVELTVTDDRGATATDTVAVTATALPVVTIEATDGAASEAGPDAGAFTVTRSGSTGAALVVSYTVGGTATGGSDYTALTGTVTIPATEATAVIVVPAVDDPDIEGSETVEVTLAAEPGYVVGVPASAVVTIADDDTLPVVTVVATDAAASEIGLDPGTFTVSRTGPTVGPLVVSYAMSGSATNTTDYATLSGTVTILDGQSSATATLTPVTDALAEPTETATLTLVDTAAYDLGTPMAASVDIEDATPRVTVVATDPTATEGLADTATFTFTRTGSTAGGLTANWNVTGSTATFGTDYSLNVGFGTAVFAPGSATTTVVVTAAVDAVIDPDETVIVNLTAGAAYVIGSPNTATATIVDATPTVTVVATDATATEGLADTATFTFTRTGSTAGGLTASWNVTGSTAVFSTDYSLNVGFGTAVFAPGSATTTVVVTAAADAVIDPDETVIVNLAAGAAYVIGSPNAATATIADATPTVTVEATDASATEGLAAQTATFTFTRTGSTAAGLTANWNVTGSTATFSTDYSLNVGFGTAVFAPGSATATVVVTAAADAVIDPDETVIVNLAAGATYVIGSPNTATATIVDATPTVTVAATDASATEGLAADTATFTFTRTGSTAAGLTASWNVTGSTATFSTDYSLNVGFGTAVFAPGSATATVVVTAAADAVIDPDETVIVNLAAGAAYAIGSPNTATATIVDATPTVTVVATDALATETGGNTGLWTLTRTGSTAASLTVNLSYSGTATINADYTNPGSTVFFPIGQATTTVTLTAVNDGVPEVDETAILTVAPGGTYFVGAPSSASVTINDQVLAPMSIGLVGTSVVGVGRTAEIRVTLTQPAPAGGVAVSFVSSDPTILTFSGSPNVTVLQGTTTAQVTLLGVVPGSATITATATGFVQATAVVPVTLNLLTTPPTLNVGVGATTSLPISIGPSPAPPGGIIVDVVSANGSIIEVLTAQVTIGAGQSSANAIVRGAGAGSATVTVSHASYSPSTTTVSSTGSLNIVQTSATFNNGFTPPQITVQLESVGNATPAPSNLVVTLSATGPTCVAVPGTITILAGQVSASFQPNYGGSATLPCTTTVTASLAGLTPDTMQVTVNPQPGVSMPGAITVGAWLQVSTGATLGTGSHSGVTVTIASDTPGRVLVSPNGTTGGTASFTMNLSVGQTSVPYHVQGVEGTTGSATVTVSAPGFLDGTHTVTVVPSGVEFLGFPDTTTTLSANSVGWYPQVGLPNAGGTALSQVQNVRAGGPPFVVTFSNSNAAVGLLTSDEPVASGQVVTKPIQPNIYYSQAVLPGTSYGLGFDPLSAGSTTVTVAGPAGVAAMTTSGVRSVTVSGPGITMPGTVTVGASLQVASGATLGASAHGGVTARVTSSDPTRVLVSPNATTGGTAFIDVVVPNGQTSVPYHVQGVEDTTGSSTVSVVTPGFPNGSHTVTVVQSGVEFHGLPDTTTTLSANATAWYPQVGLPNAGGTALSQVQNVRAGGPPFVVTFSNSNAAVGLLTSDEPVASGQVVTKPIRPNIYYSQAVLPGTSYGLGFDPLSAGSTTVTIAGPAGVATMTTNGVRSVTVSGPGITMPGTVTVGAWLQLATGATLGAGAHGGVTARVTSSDPTRVLVSPNATTAGTAFIDVVVPNGQTSVPYHVQGVEGTTGSSTVTVVTPGFPSGSHTVTVVPIGVEFHGLPATMTTLSANATGWYPQVGIPNAGGTALGQVQNVRTGGQPFIVTFSNSNALVGLLTSDEPVASGQVVTKPIRPNIYYSQAVLPGTSYGLGFDPFGPGTTTVTIAGPAGVATMTTNGVRTVGVSAPGISAPAATTVGAGLQVALGATLGGSEHGGVTVAVTSSAPGLVLVSPNATTGGTGSIGVNLLNGQTSVPFHVQGVENTSGTAVVTISAPGFFDAQFTVTVVPSGVEIHGLDPTRAAGAAEDTDVYVQVGIPNSINTALAQTQNVRAGHPGFVVTLTNSNAAAAQLRSDQPAVTGQIVTKPVQPNIYYSQAIVGGTSYGLAFDPIAQGSTTVTATGPAGVITMTTNGVRAVTVTP